MKTKIAGKYIETKKLDSVFMCSFLVNHYIDPTLSVSALTVKRSTTATKDAEVVAVGCTDSLIICKHYEKHSM